VTESYLQDRYLIRIVVVKLIHIAVTIITVTVTIIIATVTVIITAIFAMTVELQLLLM
jgi:hypothetical protein